MTKLRYRIEVARRKQSDAGYETKPFYAVAWHGKVCVAVQYGNSAGAAFQRAWNVVQEHRERKPVKVDV